MLRLKTKLQVQQTGKLLSFCTQHLKGAIFVLPNSIIPRRAMGTRTTRYSSAPVRCRTHPTQSDASVVRTKAASSADSVLERIQIDLHIGQRTFECAAFANAMAVVRSESMLGFVIGFSSFCDPAAPRPLFRPRQTARSSPAAARPRSAVPPSGDSLAALYAFITTL